MTIRERVRRVKKEWNYRKIYNQRMSKLLSCNTTEIFESAKRFVFWGSPEYNNLGDHAIAYATIEFLKKNYPNIEIIEISENQILQNTDGAYSLIKSNDIIILIGGGNLGSQYLDQRLIRNAAILHFKNHPIIIFPQTSYYSKNVFGNKILKEDISIFQSHNNLYVFLREKYSYEFMKGKFIGCELYCVPDIVFSLERNEKKDRKGALICLRNDVERILSDEEVKSINKQYCNAEWIDTCLDRDICMIEREEELNRFLDKIEHAEIVITDRLHCMIFCAITGTPCLVFNNYNHKIKGTYEWISGKNNIALIENIKNLNNKHSQSIQNENLNLDYSVLTNTIFKLLK